MNFFFIFTFFIFLAFFPSSAAAEPFRALVAGEVLVDNAAGGALSLAYNESAVLTLGEDVRFVKGVELELTVPADYLPFRGSLALAVYGDLDQKPEPGVADLEGRRLIFQVLPNKIQTVYQLPLREDHGLRASPYAAVPTGVIGAASFPLLFRVMPVAKGLNEEIETMRFKLTVRPLVSDEGALRLRVKYPEQLPRRPFTVLIDDRALSPEEARGERLIREGDHHLMILSDDYRNESRQFRVERGKTLELTVHLQDPTPLLLFEAPENAEIFLDGRRWEGTPAAVEPGNHEVRFQMSDYAVVKTVTVQKGKTYRVALLVEVTVQETD